jgi:3-hydroxyacyl-CoA dehydrogenase
MDRLDGTLELATLRHSEAVVEAIVEQLPAKRALLAQLEHTVSAECLLATNTSSLAVSDLQAGLHHPERVVGLHFFNPVDKMPLVEVVRGRHTSDAALTRACALALQLEKTPVVVADVPGFLVNRILGPYLDEALALLAGGVPAADLDAALKQFGMPMGPLALLDEVGFDVAAHAAQTLVNAYGSRMGSQAWLGMAVQRGVLGKKTGRGFYLHAAPKGRPSARTERAQLDPQAANLLTPTAVRCELRTPDELATRLVAATCAEAFRCLEAGVTSSEEELDLAFVPQQAGDAGRCDHQRHLVFGAENGGFLRALGHVNEGAGAEADTVEYGAVVAQRHLVFGAAVDELKKAFGHALDRDFAQVEYVVGLQVVAHGFAPG